MIDDVVKTAEESQGSALRENERYMQSIEGSVKRLSSAWDKLWINDKNREVITLFVDWGRAILEVTDKIGVLKTLIFTGGGIFTAIRAFKNEGRVKMFTLANMPSVI